MSVGREEERGRRPSRGVNAIVRKGEVRVRSEAEWSGRELTLIVLQNLNFRTVRTKTVPN